ncbi:MAG: helix-turn-helix transcriptional regulator [Clostridium sp.]
MLWKIFFQNQYKNFTVQSLFQILFSKLKESLSYNKSSTFHEMALQQLHINIASNPSSPWNIPDMAKQLHISTRHLQKLYQKKFGTSCMEDVIEHRLLLAKEKLATTTLPIYKIAEQCGYSNVEHFSRQFKEKFTTSPKAYRESVKKN